MLKNITMGQYYPVDSFVHRLDPRIKIVLTIAFIVAVFMVHSLVGYAVVLGFVYLTSRMANIPFRMLTKGLKPLRFILVLTFLLNLFFSQFLQNLRSAGTFITDNLAPRSLRQFINQFLRKARIGKSLKRFLRIKAHKLPMPRQCILPNTHFL